MKFISQLNENNSVLTDIIPKISDSFISGKESMGNSLINFEADTNDLKKLMSNNKN